MVQTSELTNISRRAVDELSARYDEPEWLLRRRLEAWRLFEEAPMPDPLSNEWKRFDTSRLTLEALLPYASDGKSGTAELGDELAGQVMQSDSAVTHRELNPALAQQGVVLQDMHSAAREHEALVREHFGSLVGPAEWKYSSLHSALWSGGCFIYVPAGVEVALPIEYLIEIKTSELAVFPHLLIVAEPDSRVTVIQESVSPELAGLNVVSGAVEVIVRQGAQVRFVDVQRWGRNVQNFFTMRASLASGASFEPIMLGLGARLTKSRLDVLLQGDGSSTKLLGLFFGDSDQRFYYDTLQDHIGPKTESDLLFKAALDGRAAMTWEGVVDVRQTASAASANQTSRNLLLSDKASASPTPILEISAFDVSKCSHGATVGPVDDEQLFYLESRGIPPEEAERMLVDGFFNEVLERVPSEALRERVSEVLEQKRQAHG
jgi:Fe-S cluster assembly protein SufD